MADSAADPIDDAPRQPVLLRLLRPAFAIPALVVALIVAAPIVYRSSQFYGIPAIEPIVDPEIDGRVVLLDASNAFTFYKRAVSMLPSISGSIDIRVGIEAIDSDQKSQVMAEAISTTTPIPDCEFCSRTL